MKFKIVSGGERSFEEEALSTIRSRHHHDDGTRADLTIVDERSSIERKVIEEENLWRLKTRQQAADAVQNKNVGPEQQKPQLQRDEEPSPAARKNEIMASCNCGKLFSAAKSEGSTLITAFDASGNVTGTYSVSASSTGSYGASGQQKESYGAKGQSQSEYGK